MGNTFGRQVLDTVGRSIQLAVTGDIEMKTGGGTVDWSAVAAVSGAPVALEQGITVPIGSKYLRYGTCMRKNGTGYIVPAIDTDTLVIGETWLVNETVLEDDNNSNHPPLLEGGKVWTARILVGAGLPTLAAIKAAMPRLRFAAD